MGNLNQFAGIGLAVYLIAVVYNGNQAKLIQFLTQQTVFIKWLIALFILVFLAKVTKSPVKQPCAAAVTVTVVVPLPVNGFEPSVVVVLIGVMS